MQVSGRQRLGALAGVLCSATRQQAQPCKLVVFMSSCDGVEFHHQLLQGAYKHAAGRPLLTCPIWKLHGNLPQVRLLEHLQFHQGGQKACASFSSCCFLFWLLQSGVCSHRLNSIAIRTPRR